jgi:hypothetical protein
MKDFIEHQYRARILQWDEPTEDGDVVFAAYVDGKLVRANSLALFLSALQEGFHTPLLLAA